MTSRQKLRLALTDLNHSKPTPFVQHTYEHSKRYRPLRRHYKANNRKQPNIAFEVTFIFSAVILGLFLAALI